MSIRRRSKLSAVVFVVELVAGAAGWVGLQHGALAQQAASAVTASHPRVSAAEQAARDAERVRILEGELAKEQEHADEAARQRARRLASGDAMAAEESERARLRGLENIAALRRELAAALSPNQRIRSVPASALEARPRLAPDGTAAWWDVYARPRPDTNVSTVPASPVGP